MKALFPVPSPPGRKGHRRDDATTTLRLAEALGEARDVQAAGRALLVFLSVATPADSILIALYDPATQERSCIYVAGPDNEDDAASLPPLPLNDGPQSRAVLTRRPVITGDLQAVLASRPAVRVGYEQDPRVALSSIAVPMKRQGAVVGVLELQSYRLHAFSQRHVSVVQVAAGMAALALETLATSAPARRRAAVRADRRQVAAIIAAESFRPVFQPVFDLASGSVTGYEALTRFDDGLPPDQHFQRAAGCGLGLALEIATLGAIAEAGRGLPGQAWLSLNVSPDLVLTSQPLRDVLLAAERNVVVEITEHTPVGDYALFRRSMGLLPAGTELAIDDAGAGYASFRHILELQPRFVKLDRHLITGIDGDLARQALVGALAEFGRASGALLVAEGIETEAELRTLLRLNIPLGQGYLLGPPAPLPPAVLSDTAAAS